MKDNLLKAMQLVGVWVGLVLVVTLGITALILALCAVIYYWCVAFPIIDVYLTEHFGKAVAFGGLVLWAVFGCAIPFVTVSLIHDRN